jgi:pimeloyl-ACP methyl ester carboxylesterase
MSHVSIGQRALEPIVVSISICIPMAQVSGFPFVFVEIHICIFYISHFYGEPHLMSSDFTLMSVSGININVLRQGKGKPLLLLHGANGASAWLPFLKRFADSFDVLIPEHPGFGLSDDPEWLRSVPDLAMFYLDFIEQLELQDLHLVGSSLGGWIAAELAVRNALRLATLTLIAPAGLRVAGVPMGDLFIWSPEESVRNLFFDQSLATRLLAAEPTEEQMDIQLKNRFATAKLAWQPRLYNPDLEKWLHRIKIPTQIIWGVDDKIIPAACAERWQKRLPNVSVSILDRCGHLPHIEQAEIVSDKITSFIKESSE